MDDYISRQAAIDACHNWDDGKDAYAYGFIVEERLQKSSSAGTKKKLFGFKHFFDVALYLQSLHRMISGCADGSLSTSLPTSSRISMIDLPIERSRLCPTFALAFSMASITALLLISSSISTFSLIARPRRMAGRLVITYFYDEILRTLREGNPPFCKSVVNALFCGSKCSVERLFGCWCVVVCLVPDTPAKRANPRPSGYHCVAV